MISNDKVLVFDVDGTICPIRKQGQNYKDMIPYPEMVYRIKQYNKAGFRIIFNTARNMVTYQGNIGEINAKTLPALIEWLDHWDIPYDEVHVGKPHPAHGFVIDDKAVRPDEFLNKTYEELLTITGQR